MTPDDGRKHYAPPCRWTEDAWHSGWDTACGRVFVLITGGPAENQYHYCPGCGGALVAVPWQEPDDDEEDR